METIACRYSYDLRQAIESEAESFGITPSTLIENILTAHINTDGFPDLPSKHPVETGFRELHSAHVYTTALCEM